MKADERNIHKDLGRLSVHEEFHECLQHAIIRGASGYVSKELPSLSVFVLGRLLRLANQGVRCGFDRDRDEGCLVGGGGVGMWV